MSLKNPRANALATRLEQGATALRDLQTAFIVTCDCSMYIYHRGTGLKKAH